MKLTNLGTSIISLVLPDKNGKLDDVVLGYDSMDDYLKDSSYFGVIFRRVANRIGGAQFTLNGNLYKLVANGGNNTLNGGSKGFVWRVSSYMQGQVPRIIFTYRIALMVNKDFLVTSRVTVSCTLIGH